jgi:hypothetical protein
VFYPLLELGPQVVITEIDQVDIRELAQPRQQFKEMALRPTDRERRNNLKDARPALGHV